MFELFRPKPIDILAPVSGEIIPLEMVDDEVFSQKMVGDGVAIVPNSGEFVAPFDGILTKLFPTLHAYSIKHSSGLEVIVHIGVETVGLGGVGFEALAVEGDALKAGDSIIRADLERLKSLAKDTTTPIIITDMGKYREIIKKKGSVIVAQNSIMEVR
jgi:PTS system glucose-specific IIA component